MKPIEMSPEDWSDFSEGVHSFNAGRFRESQEVWERIRARHEEEERVFFQGLVQLAAAYDHLKGEGRLRGFLARLEKARDTLAVFEPEYLGIRVRPVLEVIAGGIEEARRMGDGRLEELPAALVVKLQYRRPESPDLRAELEEIGGSPRFVEGVNLFNDGYHWEAHEVWEELWREQEGEAKMYVQALLQAAAAYSFVKLGKPASARYLFEKSLEKLQDFMQVDSPVRLKELVEDLRTALERITARPENGSTLVKIPAPRNLLLNSDGKSSRS